MSVDHGFSLGSLGEVGGLELGRADWLDLDSWSRGLDSLWGCRAAVANVLVSLGAVVVGILLHQSGGTGSLLVGKFLSMVGLGVDKLLDLGNLLIDDFTIANVDQGSKVSDGCAEQGKTPDRDNLDEPVGKEGSNESLLLSVDLFHQSPIPVNKWLTAAVCKTFSANRMRWNSMRKKSASCSKSSKIPSTVSFGRV